MDLFTHSARKAHVGEPLAERMRPRTLEEFVGQRHLLGPGKLLERSLARAELPSMIFWGPPGTGKTTLARLLAGRVGAEFRQVSAVPAGVNGLRPMTAEAAERREWQAKSAAMVVAASQRIHKGQPR